MVQTSPELSAEARVLHGLLAELAAIDAPLEVLLVQGVSPAQRDSPVPDVFRRLPGVTVRTVPMGQLGQYRRHALDAALKALHAGRLRLTVRRLQAEARRFRPDLVYSAQQLWDIRIAGALARACAVPQVIHLHYLVGPWLGADALAALRNATMVLTISDFIREGALQHGVLPKRARTLYNSVALPPLCPPSGRDRLRADLSTELGLTPGSTLLGMVARLTAWKGQEELLRAAIPLMRDRPDLALLFAGAEDITGRGLASRLEELARAAGVADRVKLLGHRSDVPRLLDALDLFAHPSRDEPFGLAVVEAMAHGLPVVALREGGTAEIVLDGVTGLLVEPGDESALSEALARLLDSPEERAAMGARGRERVADEFGPGTAARRFSLLLREAVETGPSR